MAVWSDRRATFPCFGKDLGLSHFEMVNVELLLQQVKQHHVDIRLYK